MADFSTLRQRNPNQLIRTVGERLRRLRLSKGWTQEELAERSGLAVSTLKLLESKGQCSFQRLARVAVALGVDSALRNLFADTGPAESIEAVKLATRKRAPRRPRKEEPDGA